MVTDDQNTDDDDDDDVHGGKVAVEVTVDTGEDKEESEESELKANKEL